MIIVINGRKKVLYEVGQESLCWELCVWSVIDLLKPSAKASNTFSGRYIYAPIYKNTFNVYNFIHSFFSRSQVPCLWEGKGKMEYSTSSDIHQD